MAFKWNPVTGRLDLVGSGGSGVWGAITGTLSDQEDLKYELSDLVDGASSYFLTSVASDMGGGRLEMIKDIPVGGGFGIANVAVADGGQLAEFASVSGYPNATHLPSGPLNFSVRALQVGGTKVSRIYAEFYYRTLAGVNTLIATSLLSQELTGSSQLVHAYTTTPVVRGLLATDRLLVIFKASVSGVGTDPDITINIQGNTSSKCKFPEEITNTLLWGSITGTLSDQTDLQSALNAKQDDISASNNQFIYQNSTGTIEGNPNLFRDINFGGNQQNLTPEPNNLTGASLNYTNVNVEPLQNSPNENYAALRTNINLDNDSSGFDFGTNGNALTLLDNNVNHLGTGDVGVVEFLKNYFNLGNGTDPINVGGWAYNYGFGNVNANVNITGSMQGYGYQPIISAAATIDVVNAYTQAFFDGANVNCPSGYYTSFGASPSIAEIANNRNYSGFDINPTITKQTGNASATAIGIYGTYSDIDTGSFNGVNIVPSITYTGAGSFTGISINPTITDAPDNSTGLYINTSNMSGTFSSGQTPIGIDSTGRTQIQGSAVPFDGGGNPFFIHAFNAGISSTVSTTNADTVGSGCLTQLTTDDNVALTSGGFQVGQSALFSLMLPNLGASSTVDFVCGTTCIMALSGGAGTIDEYRAYRSALVNLGAATVVNNSKGYFHHSPFGTVATNAWGCYIKDDTNYMEAGLKIGGTDTPDTGFLFHVEGDSKLEGVLEHLTGNVGFFGAAPVAQQASSGAATAGVVYTATEQTMIQEMYNALRNYGLLT